MYRGSLEHFVSKLNLMGNRSNRLMWFEMLAGVLGHRQTLPLHLQ